MSKRNNRISIPEPRADLYSLMQTVKALKEQVETLTGLRGDREDYGVTFRDLLDMEIITANKYTSQTEPSFRNPVPAKVLTYLYTGAGTPEGAVTARVGSLYLRSDGGTGTTLYVKQSGTGNTGWVAK